MDEREPFIRSARLSTDKVESFDVYPFDIPAVAALEKGLKLDTVTYLVGENGSGKSTLMEALAVAAGFNAEGGTINFKFTTRASESPLHRALKLVRSIHRPRDGFFLRAESFFNVATQIEELDKGPSLDIGLPVSASYGGASLHEQSHGESFMALMLHRFSGQGLYILDEPEAALSPARQLALLHRMHALVQDGSQFVIATHSPIVMAYPGATIYALTSVGIDRIAYEDTEHFTLTRDFLNHRERFLRNLVTEE